LHGCYSDIAASKRRETLWCFGARGRKLIEQPINGTANQFADWPILFMGKRAESIHDWVGKENLNLLHGSIIKTCLQWLQAAFHRESPGFRWGLLFNWDAIFGGGIVPVYTTQHGVITHDKKPRTEVRGHRV